MKRFSIILFYLFVLRLAFSSAANAQWSNLPTVNNPICTAAGYQYSPVITSDGAGGSIIAWQDLRNGINSDIYTQGISALGTVKWTTDGIAICTATGDQYSQAIVSDGMGGAIITWVDFRNGYSEIYAQRINAEGAVQWTTDGVLLCESFAYPLSPIIISDEAGGAIVTWQDWRYSNTDIFAQRISSTGTVLWAPNGVALCTAFNEQSYPTTASDDAGGAIVTWQDYRSSSNYDIYAQRINAEGAVQWSAQGVPLCTTTGNQNYPKITSDGAGGAIVTWEDNRSGATDIYASRINMTGGILWAMQGMPLCTASGYQNGPVIMSDSRGGAIVTWYDDRSGLNCDIYAQRISAEGGNLWTVNGVALCTATGDQYLQTLTTDGAGGAIVTWDDYRISSSYDVYAQKISAIGTVMWTTDGVGICTSTGSQMYPGIISDAKGGAIITWQDAHIYAQNIDRNGYLGDASPHLQSVQDVKNDQGGKVSLGWDQSYLDAYPNQIITYYSVWRSIELSAMPARAVIIKPEEMTANITGKVYRTVMTPQGSTNWELVGTMMSHYFPNYSYTAPTLSDSLGNTLPYQKFLISAHTADQFVFWDSNVDSGYSADNLSPSAVLSLSAEAPSSSSVKVHWNRNTIDPDVKYYEVYRSPVDGFIPAESLMIGLATDTLLIDGSPIPGTTNYYRVLTVDLHGNRSFPSIQASADLPSLSTYNVFNKWNLVSVPLTVSDYSKSSVYPSAISNAFAYNGGYVTTSTLTNGLAYWLKFSGDQPVTMTGFVRTTDSIQVNEGWNLIGSISSQVDVAHITSIPLGIVTSQFFGYNGGYTTASAIEPGKGYWVKVNQAGKLILSSVVNNQSSIARIKIAPTSELPPSPPEDINSNNSIIPSEFALEQNYPNPFNPATVISYQLPSNSFVTLKVYDMLGRNVATLIDEMQDAGFKSVQFGASNLPSGVYTYRLNAGNFVETKRMILMK